MAELNWMERNGLSPAKAALVGGLALVFVSVVGYQMLSAVFRSETTQQAVELLRPAKKVFNELAAAVKRTAEPKRKATRVWPNMAMEDALAHDPFQLPDAMKAAVGTADTNRERSASDVAVGETQQPARSEWLARRAKRLSDMQRQGAEVVVIGNGRALAVIDGVELHVGDVIDGLRIENITRLGIELVEVEPKP